MSAAAAIVVSSSPPRIFAHSPTPVDSSPSLPSPAELFRSDAEALDRFRSARKQRDGFTSEFKSARAMLGHKRGAENVPFRSPGKERFKGPEPRSTPPSPRFIFARSKSQTGPCGSSIRAHDMRKVLQSRGACAEPTPIESNQATDAPSVLNPRSGKAIPGRIDWTPPQERCTSRGESPSSPTTRQPNAFSDGLMRSFSFDGNLAVGDDSTNEPIIVKCTTKRKRINLVGGVAAVSRSKAKKGANNVAEKAVAKKRSRSPAKKAMTITNLATSNYFGLDEGQNESPMMQYLSATQARTMEDAADDFLSGERAFNVSEKSGTKKRRGQKSSFMSPQSAMKALEMQATIFGSASQLARDEDPRQQPLPDPLSTQQTQPISIESTPRTERGTSRFMKTRNLWGVSARDDYNALLHVDSVDLFDTPNMRDAFAGKDVLLEPESRRVDVLVGQTRSPTDIDDLKSPVLRGQPQRAALLSSRSFHTTAIARSPTKGSKKALEPEDGASAEANSEIQQDVVAPKRKNATPKKPSYAGLTTQDLQKQLSAFGFKPVKKREKMVELLEICWEQKHGKQVETIEAPKHGDFLTKFHDVSSRPQPKVKKPKRTKADQAEKSPKKATKRQKKAVETGEAPPPVKRGRKKKSDAPPLSEVKVVDVDDVQSPAPVPPSKDEIIIDHHIPTITPPATIPGLANEPGHNSDSRSANQAESLHPQHTKTTTQSTLPQSASDAIGPKIHAAIMKQSDLEASAPRNHILNPTWHEKILLYDPIVLEDLTAWLNTEGLGLVGEDGEVSAVEVREWCEGEGVCCLWRGGWRGNGRKGEEGGVED